MSEIINLIPNNPDVHIYAEAVNILADRLIEDYSFIINVWDHEMPTDTKYPKILISTSDEAHKMPSQAYDSDFVHIFKQYHPMTNTNDPLSVITSDKVTAIPLCELQGVEDRNIPISERKYDWSWMGQFDPYRRVEFRDAIDTLAKNEKLTSKVLWYEGWNNGESIESYSDVINQTKIMPVPRGSGSLESFRFFEALKCGCIPMCTQQPHVDFYNVAPYFSIPSWDHFGNFVKSLKERQKEIEYLSEQARNWYNYFCSPEGLAKFMYKSLVRS
tara:strand:+ start:8404 stop:9222 length:819 start_codon:yes stop_codon:yes gene_type:complete